MKLNLTQAAARVALLLNRSRKLPSLASTELGSTLKVNPAGSHPRPALHMVAAVLLPLGRKRTFPSLTSIAAGSMLNASVVGSQPRLGPQASTAVLLLLARKRKFPLLAKTEPALMLNGATVGSQRAAARSANPDPAAVANRHGKRNPTGFIAPLPIRRPGPGVPNVHCSRSFAAVRYRRSEAGPASSSRRRAAAGISAVRAIAAESAQESGSRLRSLEHSCAARRRGKSPPAARRRGRA